MASLEAALASPALADRCEAPLPKKGETFSGEVTYIVDGDGFFVGKNQGGIEVRLADFNACELNEEGGQAAKENLRKIVFGKHVECVAGRSLIRSRRCALHWGWSARR